MYSGGTLLPMCVHLPGSSEHETTSPSASVRKMSLPDTSDAPERAMRTAQLTISSSLSVPSSRETVSAFDFISSLCEFIMKFWPMQMSATPIMRKLISTISAVERKFLK